MRPPAKPPVTVAVITVSDRCFAGEMRDTAGPAVADILHAAFPAFHSGQDSDQDSGLDLVMDLVMGLVPDEADRIQAILEAFCAQDAALVLTVGGTGLGPRDVTPEATKRVIEREIPGLAEAMRFHGATKNRFAWLSRAVAGLRGATLIVNLPGSERGATESLAAILPLLGHAIEIAAGGKEHPAG